MQKSLTVFTASATPEVAFNVPFTELIAPSAGHTEEEHLHLMLVLLETLNRKHPKLKKLLKHTMTLQQHCCK